jgi:hypothetical protein
MGEIRDCLASLYLQERLPACLEKVGRLVPE